jgi:UDP-N-acetylglucosamine:LPS N-acetylglucosamine transferase
VTGFPLPPSLVGGRDGAALRRNLAARLPRLDPRGAFRDARREEIARELGMPADGPAGPPTIVYAVGGAGAQVGLARTIVLALREGLRSGAVRLVLVAGTRERVAASLRGFVDEAGVAGSATVLFESEFDAYLARFNEALAAADILWTKPSELTFYAALGLPLLLSPPLGVHEARNRAWAASLGAAVDASDVRGTAARLPSLLADGTLAAAAWAGFRGMPQLGTWNVLDVVARG